MPFVTMIHGISNKPPEDLLLASWEDALSEDSETEGLDLPTEGIGTSMVYWADVLYEEPGSPAQAHESTGSDAITSESDEDQEWMAGMSDEERAFIESIAGTLGYEAPSPAGDDYVAPAAEQDGSFERIPIPWFIKRRLMKVLLRDVHHYLFNSISRPRPGEEYRVQDEIRKRFVDRLKRDAEASDGGPHIVLGHSMGTVIAYDCLKRVPDCPQVDALVTIGSPLGLDEIQDKLQPGWTRDEGYPTQKVGKGWANFYDGLDVVAALDTNLANDYRKNGQETISDVAVTNSGVWRHDATKYLAQAQLRGWMRDRLGLPEPL